MKAHNRAYNNKPRRNSERTAESRHNPPSLVAIYILFHNSDASVGARIDQPVQIERKQQRRERSTFKREGKKRKKPDLRRALLEFEGISRRDLRRAHCGKTRGSHSPEFLRLLRDEPGRSEDGPSLSPGPIVFMKNRGLNKF